MSRTATLVTVLLIVTAGAWWGGLLQPSVGLPARPGPPAPPAGAVPAPPLVALDRLRRVPPPPPAAAGRDPFQPARAAHASAGARVGPDAGAELPPGADTRTAPSWPRIELIGIAERTADGGETRVAIIAGSRGVHHVRAGEIVEQVYRVERVGTDAIEVRLVPEDRVFRVALR